MTTLHDVENRLGQIDRDMESRLGQIDRDMEGIKDTVKDIKKAVSDHRRWWQTWGIPAAAATLVITLLAFFITNYIGLQNQRNDLQRQVSTLQGQVSNLNAMRDLVSQYGALTTYALQQNKLSQQEVSEFVKGTPGLAPAGPLRTVQITDPSERSQAPDGMVVRGIISSSKIHGATIVSDTCWTEGCSNSRPSSEKTIWILTENTATNRFFPQGRWSYHAGPVLINDAGQWVSPAVFMGATPRGAPVLIDAVLVGPKGEDVFKAYLEKGEATRDFLGLTQAELPAGMDILDTVMVFRK